MKRKIEDKHVVVIKQMLAKGYKTVTIKDCMKLDYNVNLSSSDIIQIRKGNTYYEVRSDLNESIRATLSISEKIDTEKISEIKWALTNEEFSEDEIMCVFNVTKKKLMDIRMRYSPYDLIATEYNHILEDKWPRKKRANISKRVVFEIKKEFVKTNGEIKLTEIAEKYKLDKGCVSMILSLKQYKDFGVSYNSKIISIKNKMEKLKIKKQILKKKEQIEKEKNKNNLIKQKQKQISDKLTESNLYLKKLKDSI